MQKLTDEITDKELEQYIIEELFPLWEKLGKALKLPGEFLKTLIIIFQQNQLNG